MLFFVAIAIILIFYLPVTLTGIVGSFVKNLFFGLIGCMAYAILFIFSMLLLISFSRRGREYQASESDPSSCYL